MGSSLAWPTVASTSPSAPTRSSNRGCGSTAWASSVIDEQHRFGVEQRAALRAKGEEGEAGTVPDVLVMTATPIPRTAAMTVYGDLDVSTITSKPAGRQEIVTSWANGPLMEEAVWAQVRSEVAEGRQAYVVCPLIEESDKLEAVSAEETFERLSSSELAGLRLGLLHGRLGSAEKEAVMGTLPRRRAGRAGGDHRDRGGGRRPERHDHGRPRRRPVRHRTAAPAPRSGRPGPRRVDLLAGDDAARASRRPGSRLWSTPRTGSCWPRSTSTCGARAPS